MDFGPHLADLFDKQVMGCALLFGFPTALVSFVAGYLMYGWLH